jgi:hypothetical protein
MPTSIKRTEDFIKFRDILNGEIPSELTDADIPALRTFLKPPPPNILPLWEKIKDIDVEAAINL